MEETMSKRDWIVTRGIWYVMTLVSIIGLSISLNILWPPGNSSSSSRFARDFAVSATTFYAVTLLRYLFFTDLPSTCYKEFNTKEEKSNQLLVSYIALSSLTMFPVCLAESTEEYLLSATFFMVSLVTGGIGLIQLADKLRMETRHAYLTLFLVWLYCPFVTYLLLYCLEEYFGVVVSFSILYHVLYLVFLSRISHYHEACLTLRV